MCELLLPCFILLAVRCKLVQREAWVERTETIPVSNCFQRVKGLIVLF